MERYHAPAVVQARMNRAQDYTRRLCVCLFCLFPGLHR